MEEDILCIKDYIDRQDLMIVGRHYYFTYNVHKDRWDRRNTLDRSFRFMKIMNLIYWCDVSSDNYTAEYWNQKRTNFSTGTTVLIIVN